MPFTFSHPAVVLPLTYLPRKWVSLTGLVIGSMTPDFEYFLRMKIQSTYSHTLTGLLWFDLPLGILLTFLFHHIIRNRLVENLPAFLRLRFSTYTGFNWGNYVKKNFFVVAFSLLIGAASHLLWDSFTHEYGYFVQKIPILAATIDLAGQQIPVLKILQHSSTLIGALVIAFAIYRLPLVSEAPRQISAGYWKIVAVITLFVVVLRLLGGLDFRQYGNVLVTVISAGMMALILASLLLRLSEGKGGKSVGK